MMIVFYFLLMLRVGRCTAAQFFETNAVGVGDDVTLTCPRQESPFQETLFWVRLVSGNFPEVLGGTFTFDYKEVDKTPRFTAEQGPGTFLLHIHKTKSSDTGVYYCIKVDKLKMTFFNGTFLRIKGTEPDISAVIQDFLSDPVRPGDSVTLQCSVLSDSESKCPGEHSVFWFRAGSDESHPSLIYAHGNSDECENSLEARSPQKCIYSFSKNISSSDTGTYYCAVATCGEILFGRGTKLDVEVSGLNIWDLQKANAVLILSCTALALSLVVIAFLIYTIKMKTCDCCNAVVALQTNAATARGHHQSQRRDEDSLAYSAPTFTKRKTGRAERRKAETAEGETIYTDVRT